MKLHSLDFELLPSLLFDQESVPLLICASVSQREFFLISLLWEIREGTSSEWQYQYQSIWVNLRTR